MRVFAICGLLLAVVAMNAAPIITYTGLPGTGIELLLPSSPEFTAALTASQGADAVARYQPVLPYTVIVKNNTTESLWVVAVRTCQKEAGGRVICSDGAMTTSPLSSMSSLGPGAMVALSPYGPLTRVLNPSAPPNLATKATSLMRSPEDTVESLARQPEVDITLDCVVFADGGVIGPDEGHHMDELIGSARARSALYSDLMNLSGDAAREYLSRIADAPMPEWRREEADWQAAWYERERWFLAKSLLNLLKSPRTDMEWHDFFQGILKTEASQPVPKRRAQ